MIGEIGKGVLSVFPRCFLCILHQIFSFSSFTTQSQKKEAVEYNVLEEENASNQHFLPLKHCFLVYQRQKSIELCTSKFVICRCFKFGQVQNCMVKGQI